MRDLVEQDKARAGAQPPVGDLLRPGEVAVMLGVSRSWLYEAAKDGRVPCVRLGGPDGPLRFVARDLSEWLERARAGWLPGNSTAETVRRATAA
jgi:excisionase family DNA binding protein